MRVKRPRVYALMPRCRCAWSGHVFMPQCRVAGVREAATCLCPKAAFQVRVKRPRVYAPMPRSSCAWSGHVLMPQCRVAGASEAATFGAQPEGGPAGCSRRQPDPGTRGHTTQEQSAQGTDYLFFSSVPLREAPAKKSALLVFDWIPDMASRISVASLFSLSNIIC